MPLYENVKLQFIQKDIFFIWNQLHCGLFKNLLKTVYIDCLKKPSQDYIYIYIYTYIYTYIYIYIYIIYIYVIYIIRLYVLIDDIFLIIYQYIYITNINISKSYRLWKL